MLLVTPHSNEVKGHHEEVIGHDKQCAMPA